jgi:hypothetical protein
MNKKTLGVILVVLIVAVVGVAYFGFQKNLFTGEGIGGIVGGGIGGIREDSMMGGMRKQGQPVPSKSEFIGECKKSDKESQDECYGVGAFYYRDASFCKYIKDSEAKSQCTQENIEKMYSGGGMIPGGEENTGIETPQGGGQEGQGDPYGSAQEITAPIGLASELKSIFSEVCNGAKLTTLNYNFPAQGSDMLVYVWKNKPTEEKLRSALVKNGYEIEEGGFSEILFAKKEGKFSLIVDWASPDREEGQEIVVMAGKEE